MNTLDSFARKVGKYLSIFLASFLFYCWLLHDEVAVIRTDENGLYCIFDGNLYRLEKAEIVRAKD